MTTTATAARILGTCTECGASFEALPYRSRAARLVSHMVNAGEITVGEAKAELTTGAGTFDREVQEILAGWILARADQGDEWSAGDPVTLGCGCRVSYDAEQPETNCDGSRCELRFALVGADA